jgi:hypothetical protein
LPSSGAKFSSNEVEKKSYDVYQYLIGSGASYSHVIFTSTGGVGYYTLLAQSQGLLCSKTKYIVGIDSLPLGIKERIESGDSKYESTNSVTLKKDFFSQKSIELAVRAFRNLIF